MAEAADITLTSPAASTEQRLEGRVVVVSGGSRGIGRAIVEELCRQGAKVAFTYLQRRAGADELLQHLAASGREAFALQADVRDFKRAQEVIEETVGRWGQLDGVVNNAGIVRDKALMLMDPSDWQEVLETNLTGVFNLCRASIVTFMKQRSGRIVNITSVSGLVGMARQVNYSASKAGIIGLTKALAKEVASHRITVNAVAPGFIETDMTQALDAQQKSAWEKQIPLGRFGRPQEVADIVSLLLGDSGSYITGQVFVIDGGLTL